MTNLSLEKIRKQNADALKYARGACDQALNGRKGASLTLNKGDGWMHTDETIDRMRIRYIQVRATQNNRIFLTLTRKHTGGIVFVDNGYGDCNFVALTDQQLEPVISCNCPNTLIHVIVVGVDSESRYRGMEVHSRSDAAGNYTVTRSYAYDFGAVEDMVHRIESAQPPTPGRVCAPKVMHDADSRISESVPFFELFMTPWKELSTTGKILLGIGVSGATVALLHELRQWVKPGGEVKK